MHMTYILFPVCKLNIIIPARPQQVVCFWRRNYCHGVGMSWLASEGAEMNCRGRWRRGRQVSKKSENIRKRNQKKKGKAPLYPDSSKRMDCTVCSHTFTSLDLVRHLTGGRANPS